MNPDDLLSFKEFQPIHDSYSQSGSAEININSPNRINIVPPYGGGLGASGSSNEKDKGFNDLLNQINSTTIQVMNTTENTQGAANPTSNEGKSHSFFSIEYYQKFFNVDTTIVRERIISSIIPRRASPTYLKQQIGSNPDLYGPFWIGITLIFSIAISGNISNYLQHSSTGVHWRYNFHLVSIAATTIVMYVCFVPLGLWAALKWFVRATDPDLETESPYIPGILTLICVYGYSLVVYIPVSILWVIQVSFLQWILVISATFLSGSVLIIILSPALRNTQISIILAAVIIGIHFLLAAGFMLYFFHVPDATIKEIPLAIVQNAVQSNNKTS